MFQGDSKALTVCRAMNYAMQYEHAGGDVQKVADEPVGGGTEKKREDTRGFAVQPKP